MLTRQTTNYGKVYTLGFYYFPGPLNGIILARTSNRTLSMIGSCIMTVSLVGFAYSPNVECMFVAYAFYGKYFFNIL